MQERMVRAYSRALTAVVIGLRSIAGWAALGGIGVFKTVDGGANWNAINTGLPGTPSSITAKTLAINPAAPATLYLGTIAYGVFKSTNGGNSWSAANVGLTNVGVNALAV